MMHVEPLDLQHLRSYTAGDPALERELFSLFLAGAAQHLEQLRRAEDMKSWRFTAHALKGSARSIGATRVARVAEAAEQLAGAPRARRVVAIYELAEAIDAVRAFFDDAAPFAAHPVG